MPETKICPDCAESVLAPARKCRYCGYRFDGARRGGVHSLLEQLGIFRKPRSATIAEILADWGIATDDDEEIAFFRYGEVDGQNSYLLVTDRRMFIIIDRRRQEPSIVEHRLAQIREVSTSRTKRHLTIRGYGFQHLIQAGSRSELVGLSAYLDEHSDWLH